MGIQVVFTNDELFFNRGPIFVEGSLAARFDQRDFWRRRSRFGLHRTVGFFIELCVDAAKELLDIEDRRVLDDRRVDVTDRFVRRSHEFQSSDDLIEAIGIFLKRLGLITSRTVEITDG
jgi:hypothetical protein